MSAMHLLVLPLSSLMVMGLPSLILSMAAGQFIWNGKKENKFGAYFGETVYFEGEYFENAVNFGEGEHH